MLISRETRTTYLFRHLLLVIGIEKKRHVDEINLKSGVIKHGYSTQEDLIYLCTQDDKKKWCITVNYCNLTILHCISFGSLC